MKRLIPFAIVLFGMCAAFEAHNVGNAITWNREISRIFYQRCAQCHHPGGTSFSLMSFPEVQPHAVDIKNSVLSRRMPPWGAVKGFGDFRNDGGLTQEELSLITDWVDSDTPKGSNPNVLPKEPKFEKPAGIKKPKNGIDVSGTFTLSRPAIVDGFIPERIPQGTPLKVVAELPNGGIEPLVWFYEYKDVYQHPFLFRKALSLPAGTVIHGLPPGASLVLIPGTKAKPSK